MRFGSIRGNIKIWNFHWELEISFKFLRKIIFRMFERKVTYIKKSRDFKEKYFKEYSYHISIISYDYTFSTNRLWFIQIHLCWKNISSDNFNYITLTIFLTYVHKLPLFFWTVSSTCSPNLNVIVSFPNAIDSVKHKQILRLILPCWTKDPWILISQKFYTWYFMIIFMIFSRNFQYLAMIRIRIQLNSIQK